MTLSAIQIVNYAWMSMEEDSTVGLDTTNNQLLPRYQMEIYRYSIFSHLGDILFSARYQIVQNICLTQIV